MCSHGEEGLIAEKRKEQQSVQTVQSITEEMTLQEERMHAEAADTNQIEQKPSFLSRVNKFVGKNEPADAAEMKQAKTLKHYHAAKKEAFSRRENERSIAQQNQALEELCEKQRKISYATPEFTGILDAVIKFLHAESDEAQQKTLLSARELIKTYLDTHDPDQDDREYELWMHIQGYDTYLDMNTNGCLDTKRHIHKTGEHEKNPKARTLTVWTNVEKQSLFPHKPSIHDIQQRTVQDCYMMSSLAAIAHFTPEYIKQSMRDNGDGTVTVRFYDEKTSDVYYKAATIEELTKDYSGAEQADREKIDRKLLLKLFSEFSVNEQLQEQWKETWEKGALPVEDENGESKAKEKTVAEGELGEIDDFEFLDDFETEIQTTDGNPENPVVKGYVSRLKNLQNSFSSSNEAWLNEMIDAILKSETEAGGKLRSVLDRIHSGGPEQAAMIAGEAFEEFAKQMCTNDAANEELLGLWRKTNRQTSEQRLRNEAVYVTVTKEVARFGGAVDAYAADSLWVQMIEKAAAVHYGGEKGYEGISLGRSCDFLKHFLNQNYEPGTDKYIINAPMESFEVHGVRITQEKITEHIRQIQRKKKSVAVSVEDMLGQLNADKECREIFRDRADIELLASELVSKFGMVHSAFSHNYTEQAVAVFEDYQERLQQKECIIVGCTWDKEQAAWLTDSGIRNGHAYSVVDCFEEDGHKFVTMRDPYALFKREYIKETDKSGAESYRIKNASSIGLSKNDSNGLFNMELNDYLMTFHEYTARKVH